MKLRANCMDERSQLVPLNLCSSAFLLDEMKSINGSFLQPPPQFPSPQLSPQSGRMAPNTAIVDLEMSFFSRSLGGFCAPPSGNSTLLPECRLQQKSLEDEPKPNFSYIGLIAKAILSSKERRMVLSEIYEWIQVNYAYFRSRGPGWRNSIRHNLSLNDCFIKVGRSSNGKGHYWGIHPANVEDFRRGDFRRRRAQRKVRRALGLSCPGDGEDSDSPPLSPPPPPHVGSCAATLPLALFPLRAGDNANCAGGGGGGAGRVMPPPAPALPPPVDVFAALLSGLATASLFSPPPHASPTPTLPRLPSLQQHQATEPTSTSSEMQSPSGGSFSVANLLGA